MRLRKNEIPLPLILDGATGTELTKRGMPQGACTERFVLDNPGVIAGLQMEYISAGSDAVLAPTFGANRPTLERHGYAAEEVNDACRSLVRITKALAGDVLVGGDMSPTGLMMQPYGDAAPEQIFSAYREQAATLLECGVDFFFIETMISAAEARLAVRAVRELSKDVPVFVSMTVNENGRTMYGDCLDAVLLTMIPYDIQGFGCNCSIGPDVILRALKPAAPIAKRYGIPPSHIEAVAKAAKSTDKVLFGDVQPVEDAEYVSSTRVWAKLEADAEYAAIDGDSEDDLYDLLDEVDPDEVLYLELKEGAADVLIRMNAFIPNPVAVCGVEEEIEKVENWLCRKVR